MAKKNDNIYLDVDAPKGSFKFDQRVADVFDDMITRSVPGYQQIIDLLPTVTRQFSVPDKNYYDLGCSTGAGLIAMAHGLGRTHASLTGVDTSSAMLEHAKRAILESGTPEHITIALENADICQHPIHDAAMVLLNFTLQFIPLSERDALITRIYDNLITGGVLVLSEKLQANSAQSQALLTRIHHQYKFDQGYSEMEISKKRDAIDNVLIPEKLGDHETRLRRAGFSTITPWVRNMQFVSILAVKE